MAPPVQHEAELLEDGLAFPGFPWDSYRYGSSDDDFEDSDDTSDSHLCALSATMCHSPYTDSRLMLVPTGHTKREWKQRPRSHDWFHTRDPQERVLLFTEPLDPARSTAVGIAQPQGPPVENGLVAPPYCFRGRIGRGGRIIFDRWNPLLQSPIIPGSSRRVLFNHRSPKPNG